MSMGRCIIGFMLMERCRFMLMGGAGFVSMGRCRVHVDGEVGFMLIWRCRVHIHRINLR